MFDPCDHPRVFGAPPGSDFPALLAQKILSAYENRPPEDLARVLILVNTRRMERRLIQIFSEGSARLLPRIRQVTDVSGLLPGADLPPQVSRLRRKLELTQLTTRLIETQPDLAARATAVDLADSLAALIDEMQGEGVAMRAFRDLNVEDGSAHWARSLQFLNIATNYVESTTPDGLDGEARRRLGVVRLIENWQSKPPETPIIVAGSTGSRSTTRMLMCAVARLPQGAVFLPGFDFDLPARIWTTLSETEGTEDHPQARFVRFLADLTMPFEAVQRLGIAPSPDRNALVSLSLRPAQVTDQWLKEGPKLGNLTECTGDVSLVEAAHPKDEALAIAVALREAVENARRAALITPDRTLARRVTAILGRWRILPDDSAGVPLSLTPPGRFLRQIGHMVGTHSAPDRLIALLKHPLCRTGQDDRGPHLLNTRRLELYLRKHAVFEVTDLVLNRFVEDQGQAVVEWSSWLSTVLDALGTRPVPRFDAALSHQIKLSELIASGGETGAGQLWETSAGKACRALLETFLAEADYSGPMPFADYLRLLETALAADSDRDSEQVRPDVMIWGTLEARVQGADLVILGGLNEGTWPEPTSPDPWLNRRMRRDLGLLLPEQQVGLAAHDYQQAVAAPNVILSRSSHAESGEAVPSRWLNRLTNLLEGLSEQSGPDALKAMRARGRRLLDLAKTLDRPEKPINPEARPAPSPPRSKRPKRLSVTEIKTLIRDPYAIYAKHVLRLRPLFPLMPKPDARLKGIVFHSILETFYHPDTDMSDGQMARARLLDIADALLKRHVPWPATRVHWLGHISQIADHLIETEKRRRRSGGRIGAEVKGLIQIGETGVTISGTADRIDRLTTGDLIIYDYKTGSVPSTSQVRYFDRQLLIEAVMAEEAAFEGLPPGKVEKVVHLHLGRNPKDSEITLEEKYETVTISAELAELLDKFNQDETGYISRRAMEKVRYEGDYDHLARFGEWDASKPTTPRPVK